MAGTEARLADPLVDSLRERAGNVPVLVAPRRRAAPEPRVAAGHARFPCRDRRRGAARRALSLPALRQAVLRDLVLLPAAAQRMRALRPAAGTRRRGGVAGPVRAGQVPHFQPRRKPRTQIHTASRSRITAEMPNAARPR